MARILYRTCGGTTVVKVGTGSLLSTIRAGLAGGVATAVAVGLLALLFSGARSQALSLFGVAISCGIALGVLWACLGALT